MMRKIVIGSIMMAIAFGGRTIKAEDLRLTLESSMRAPRLGDTATFQLKIVGDGVSDITKELFREFSADVNPPTISVIVKEPAQLAGGDGMPPLQP